MVFTQVLTLIVLILFIGTVILIAWKGKDLQKLRILQGSIFKQIGFVFSPPTSSQKNLFLSETGDIAMPFMPVSTGFETMEGSKRQWAVIHSLKFRQFKNGKPFEDKPVLIVSEKSFMPQDPNGRLSLKTREKMASLNDIARTTHMVLRAEARKAKDQADIINAIVYGSFIIDGISLVVYLIRVKMVGG